MKLPLITTLIDSFSVEKKIETIITYLRQLADCLQQKFDAEKNESEQIYVKNVNHEISSNQLEVIFTDGNKKQYSLLRDSQNLAALELSTPAFIYTYFTCREINGVVRLTMTIQANADIPNHNYVICKVPIPPCDYVQATVIGSVGYVGLVTLHNNGYMYLDHWANSTMIHNGETILINLIYNS